MSRGLFQIKPECLVIENIEIELKENQVEILSEFSAIKHGTDFHMLSGKSPFQNMKFDSNLRLFVEDQNNTEYKSQKVSFGNTTVGTVVEVGSQVTKFKSGDKVYTYGAIGEKIIADEDSVQELSPTMSPTDAVCMDPAFFALAAVRDANVKPGDNVVVFGMGAIGIFIIQFLKLNGCLDIIAVDPIEKRRNLAKQFGATVTLDPLASDVALDVRNCIGNGADIAIEASGNYRALRESMRVVQKCGKIVTIGYYKGNEHNLSLGMEWHHNRLSIISSMPVWDNPTREYPIWSEERLFETVKEMFNRKMISSENIIDPIVDFDQSADRIMEVYHSPSESIKLGVVYPGNQ